MNEIEIVEIYTTFLIGKGVEFYENGFPKFKPDWIIKNRPKIIVPFYKRHYYKTNKKDISICYFSKDEHLYPRFKNVFKEIEILKEYHSVCMMDISISPYMLDEVQRMNLLINLLYTCVLAVNGIKVIPSLRTGNFETLTLLMKSIQYSKFWVMGIVGTQKAKDNAISELNFKTKCLLISPEEVLCYGKPNNKTTACLQEYGVEFKPIYKDFRSLCYTGEINDW